MIVHTSPSGKRMCWGACLLALLLGACAPPDAFRVACVGDSITYGDGLAKPETASYPAQLQGLLGDSTVVRNFGRNGRTLLRQGHAPYWREEALAEALAFRPHVVVIMLGTNDSKPGNWQHAADFEPDYLALIDTFLALPTAPRVLIGVPPPVYRHGFEIRDHTLGREIVPAVRQVAAQRPVELLDFHRAMQGHPEWFVDGVHPTAAGARGIAEAVARRIAKLPQTPAQVSASLPKRLNEPLFFVPE